MLRRKLVAPNPTRRRAARLAHLVERCEARRMLAGFQPIPTFASATMTGLFAQAGTVDLQANAALAPTGDEASSLPRNLPVNAAGLPLLNSRPNNSGAVPIFIDMTRGPLTYNTEGDNASFTLNEQLQIYRGWRRVAGWLSPFNVNVTNVLPDQSAAAPDFAWLQTTPCPSGSAGVNTLNKTGPTGEDDQLDLVFRIGGMVHEFGHILGLGHPSNWNNNHTLRDEYSFGDGYRNVPVMGSDPTGTPSSRGWYGRADFSTGPNGAPGYLIQDDVQWIASRIAKEVGGDGFRPDDYGGTIGSAFNLAAGAQQLDGYIERMGDADVFKVTATTTGPWNFTATPLFGSGLRPNLELLDAGGNVIYGRNDAELRNGPTNEESLNPTLAPGTYYARVSNNANYSSLGYYKFGATPLPGNFTSADVGTPLVSGSVTYAPATSSATPTRR